MFILFYYEKDFELEHVIKLKNQTNCPWIMSNVFYAPTKQPLGEGIEYLIIEKNGHKVNRFYSNQYFIKKFTLLKIR